MRYLLDTCTVSDFVKGKPKVLARVKATPPALIAALCLGRCASGRLGARGPKGPGRPIGPYDVLIGATALARGLTMVTSNTDEFERIRGLRLEDWR